MDTAINTVNCPCCGSENHHLLASCGRCGARLTEIGFARSRIRELEAAGDDLLQKGEYLPAFRAFAVLLEYQPNMPRYHKGLCKSSIGLGQMELAGTILEELEKRIKSDPELEEIRALLSAPAGAKQQEPPLEVVLTEASLLDALAEPLPLEGQPISSQPESPQPGPEQTVPPSQPPESGLAQPVQEG